MSFLSGLSSIFGASGGSPASALFGNSGLLTNPSSAWDQFKNGQSNVVNKEIADQNLAFQRENLEYQKALQEKIFEREDTAYQRTVNDMRAAGMSPLSMQSTNGAGEAIQTQALHNDFQYQDSGNLQAFTTLMSVFNDMANNASMRSLQGAEARKLNAEATETEHDIAFGDMIDSNTQLPNWVSSRNFDFNLKKNAERKSSFESDEAFRDFYFNQMSGLTKSMTPDERRATLIGKALGLFDVDMENQGLSNDKMINTIGGLLTTGFGLDVIKSIFGAKFNFSDITGKFDSKVNGKFENKVTGRFDNKSDITFRKVR